MLAAVAPQAYTTSSCYEQAAKWTTPESEVVLQLGANVSIEHYRQTVRFNSTHLIRGAPSSLQYWQTTCVMGQTTVKKIINDAHGRLKCHYDATNDIFKQ